MDFFLQLNLLPPYSLYLQQDKTFGRTKLFLNFFGGFRGGGGGGLGVGVGVRLDRVSRTVFHSKTILQSRS